MGPSMRRLALVAVAAAGALAFTLLREPPPRELVLTARDMAFVLSGGTDRNPTLRLRAGERVRIVLENRDPGMRHDLVARSLGLRIPALAHGGSDERVLRVPRERGEHDYVCSYHVRLMRGRMVVE